MTAPPVSANATNLGLVGVISGDHAVVIWRKDDAGPHALQGSYPDHIRSMIVNSQYRAASAMRPSSRREARATAFARF